MTRLLKKHQWLFFGRLEEAGTCVIPKKLVSPGLPDTDQCLGNGLCDLQRVQQGCLGLSNMEMLLHF